MIRISDVPTRLKEYREAHDLTLADMEKITEIPAQTLNRYELGQRAPKLDVAIQIAESLKINPMWIQGFDVPEDIPEITTPVTETDDGQIGKIMHVVKKLNPENQNKVADYAHKLSEIQQMQEAADDSLATE